MVAPSVVPGDLWSSADVSTGLGFSSALWGSCSAALRATFDDVPGTSNASCSFADPLHFRDDNDASDKGDKESPALGKGDLSRAFRKVVSLITGFFFLAPNPQTPPPVDLSPWFDDFGVSRRRDPCVFLSLFDNLPLVKRDIEEKFHKTADEKKKAINALPNWGDVYCFGGMHGFYKAPKINESFSRLLDKPVSTSRYVSLFLDESAKL